MRYRQVHRLLVRLGLAGGLTTEANVVVRLGRLLAALGGPDYRIRYPNGDETACVPIVYEARVQSGDPAPDGDETSEIRWFHPDELAMVDLNELNRNLLAAVLPLLKP